MAIHHCGTRGSIISTRSPAPHTARAQKTRRLAAQRRQLPESESFLGARDRIDVPEGRSVRTLLGPTVGHIGGKVEIGRRYGPARVRTVHCEQR